MGIAIAVYAGMFAVPCCVCGCMYYFLFVEPKKREALKRAQEARERIDRANAEARAREERDLVYQNNFQMNQAITRNAARQGEVSAVI